MNGRKRHKRSYWINSRLQRQYLRQILMVELVVMAMTAVLTFAVSFALFNPNFQAGPSWTTIYVVFAALTLAMAGGLVYIGIRVSHKVYGPIYRLKKSLQAIADGEPPAPVRLRKGDELQDLAQALNDTLQQLSSGESRSRRSRS